MALEELCIQLQLLEQQRQRTSSARHLPDEMRPSPGLGAVKVEDHRYHSQLQLLKQQRLLLIAEAEARDAHNSRVNSGGLPPLDFSHYYSRVTRNRQASNMKDFYKYFTIPGIGNLAGGMPHYTYFPFDTLEGAAALPGRFKPTPNEPVDPPSASQKTPGQDSTSSRVLVPRVSESQDILRKIDVKSALQYGTAQGYPPLYAWLRQFTRENLHPNVPYVGGPEIILTCGSTDGFAKTVEALTNVWADGRDPVSEREGILCEEFCYTNAIQSARPRGLNIVPVAIDDEGMKADGPDGLEDVLRNWDESRGKRPHLIYTVTIGQNPTSGTLGVERRKAIYAVCIKYDVLIIEDDPYWYLQYPSANSHPATDTRSTNCYNKPRSSGFPFLDSLVPSYLSVDTQGRVIRLDTFSKTVAPGCRLGWITAQPALVERLLRITETSTQQPSGFVQSMIAQLLMGPQSADGPTSMSGKPKQQTGWDVSGWVRWLEGLRGNYERRMNTMCKALSEGQHVVEDRRRASVSVPAPGSADPDDDDWAVVEKKPLYSFTWPLGGMFVWLRMNFETHPLHGKVPHAKLARGLWIHLTEEPFRVLVSPGSIFAPTQTIRERSYMYFRICFAAVEDELVAGHSKRFVDGVADFWTKKNPGDIEEAAARFTEDEIEEMCSVAPWC